MRQELDAVLRIVEEHEGANSNKIQHLAAQELGSLKVAQNRLKTLAQRGEIIIRGWNVYPGGKTR